MGDQAAQINELVAALDRLSLAINTQSSRSGGGPASSQGVSDWELISDRGREETHPTDLDRRRALVTDGDYEGFAQLLPPCPQHVISNCKRLSGGGVSSEFRAKRAFEAGYWARLTLAGRLAKPRGTQALNLSPKVYVILKARGIQSPTRFSTASDLYRISGRFDEGTICHGFPSLAEAEAYCAGAGINLPDQHQWS